MVWKLAVLMALLTLGLAACGDDDEGSGGSSDAGVYGSSYATEDEAETAPALEPTAEECGGDAPVEVAPPSAYDGLIRLCEPEVAKNLLVVWNISNAVIFVEGDARNPALEVWGADGSTLATRVVRALALPPCGDTWCRILPGGHLEATGLAPVGVILSVDRDSTAAVALATSVASTLESKLQSAGRRGAAAAAACAKNTGSAVNAENWEERFRYALTASPSCNSLRKIVFPSDVPKPAVSRVLTQARSLSGGLWVDALVTGSKLLR